MTSYRLIFIFFQLISLSLQYTICYVSIPYSFQRLKTVSSKFLLKSSISTDLESDDNISINEPEQGPLNTFQRLGRAVSFYSTAIPKLLLTFKKNILNRHITIEEEEKLYSKLHNWGSEEITDKIKELKGFYVKTGQIISTRVDIFPEQYTSKLSIMQDALDPLPGYVIKNIVSEELLNGADLSDLFAEFDDEPLGSASIAQVHKARLLDGRQVAVKVQRPGIEGKLLADITNLKSFAKIVSSSLPIDYYKVFCELEKSLKYELDFLYESQSTYKIASAVNHLPNNKPTKPPVVIPLPITGLVTRKVLVMEFIEGIPLSKLSTELAKRNITLNSIESKIFGNKLLSALTDAYGYMIFGSGIIHADPHPGNIFIMPDNSISLLDCGQIKELTTYQRLGLADLILSINKWEKLSKKIETSTVNEKSQLLPQLDELTHITATKVKSFNVRFKEGVNDTCAAAVAILLFGNTDTKLPGGYAGEEISKDSPIVQVAEFPQELVLLGRATVMIRGIANRLGISWGLSDRWAAIASDAIEASSNPKESLPIWSVSQPSIITAAVNINSNRYRNSYGNKRIRFEDVISSFKIWIEYTFTYFRMKLQSLITKFIDRDKIRKLLNFYLSIKNKIFRSSV